MKNKEPNHDLEQHILQEERWGLLQEISTFLDKPLILLSFIWLILIILEFTEGLNPSLQWVAHTIWGIFILDFVIELIIAPSRLDYLKTNWLTALSIVLPALRTLQILQFSRFLKLAQFGRPLSLLRLITSIRRGMSALNITLGKRKFGYVASLTVLIIFTGAAGMANLESPQALREAGYLSTNGLQSYGDALWWTAMIMTTLGSEYWPKTVTGRLLAWLLSLYAVTVFGYITATLASHFIQTDDTPDSSNLTGIEK